MDRDSNKPLYERFTTKGIPKDCLQAVSFASRYCLNYISNALTIQRSNRPNVSNDSDVRRSLHQFQRSDLIRATGIRYHLDMAVMPRSGYKVKVVMF